MFAIIQSFSVKGDVADNVRRHVSLARVAAAQGARLVLFPELSLTGYELAIAHEVAVSRDDVRLDALQALAREHALVIVAGAPLRDEVGLQIAALLFLPDGSRSVYCKQHLHGGEADIFVAGHEAAMLDVDGMRTALAICADIAHPEHMLQARQCAAEVYAASVLVSVTGYDTDAALLQGYAQAHRLPVLMANHAGLTGGWQSAGRSAAWDEKGELIAAAPDDRECMLLIARDGGGWRGRVLPGEA